MVNGVLTRVWNCLRSLPLRLAVLSGAAAAVAFALGSLTTHASPVVAAITALILVRPTFHASLRDGLREVVGVLGGAALAYAAVSLIGFSAIALFVTVVACFLVARLARLGDDGAVAVAVTVILVAGPHWDVEAVETRLLGVLLGAVVALAVSFFTRPGTPHGRALIDAVAEGERTSTLLADIGAGLAQHRGRIPEMVARSWLADAEDIVARATEVRQEAEDAVVGAAWSPLLRRSDAEAVLEQARIAESAALTVLGTCRDLLAAVESGSDIPHDLAASLSTVLVATADAITEQADAAMDNPAEALSPDVGAVPALVAPRREAVDQVRALDDTQPMLLGGSLLRDSEAITELLQGR